MVQLDKEEVKKYQLNILDEVANFCEKNMIHYWLDSGTLLGAIRHKGYIPWDDDIDIGMLRPDFDKFLNEFNKNSGHYKLITNELDKTCVYPYGKVLDIDTALYEPDENGIKISINIDIFVYDNAPDNDSECRKIYNYRDIYSILNNLQNKMIGSHGIIKDIVKAIGYIVLKIFPKGYFARRIVSNSKKYSCVSTARVGNFTAVSRIACEKDIFSSFIKVTFEGKQYDAPIGYDRWLKAFYGDYMTLPPKEKRVSHHVYKAYKEDKVGV